MPEFFTQPHGKPQVEVRGAGFTTAFGTKLALREVAREIVDFMKAQPDRRYKVTIGTDSLQLANKYADFVTAVVVHRVGNGGRYFYRRFEFGKFHTLRDRILKEVLVSLDLGQAVLLELKKLLATDAFLSCVVELKWDFEIHIDVGEKGPTKQMIQEVVGMVRAHNFEPITKPGSYAASNVADRHV